MAEESKRFELKPEDKKSMLDKSFKILPDNPSNKGFNAAQIKLYGYKPSEMLFDWLAEALSIINAYEDETDEKIGQLNQDLSLFGQRIELVYKESTNSNVLNLISSTGSVISSTILPYPLVGDKEFVKRFTSIVNDREINVLDWLDNESTIRYSALGDPKDIRKHEIYKYSLDYFDLDYKFGKKFMDERYKPNYAACSSARKGNLYGRNLDWYFDYGAEVVIRTAAYQGRYATLGVLGAISTVTEEFMNKSYTEMHKALPFMIVDGINEKGLFMNINVVHTEKGYTLGTVPTGVQRDSVCTTMLVRYCLDRYATALEAIDDLTQHVSIYANKLLLSTGLDAHFMIGDTQTGKTYVLEFIENRIRYRELNIMTNFHVVGVTFNADGSVYTPEDCEADPAHDAIEVNQIEETGMGLERHNLINETLPDVSTIEDMTHLFKDLLDYRRAYSTFSDVPVKFWYTEFCERYQGYNCYVNSPLSNFERPVYVAGLMYSSRSRDDGTEGTWHTSHTAIYDLSKLELTLYGPSESGVAHKFSLIKHYEKPEIDEKLTHLLPKATGTTNEIMVYEVLANGTQRVHPKSYVGKQIDDFSLTTEQAVIAEYGGVHWTLLGSEDGLYQWKRTA